MKKRGISPLIATVILIGIVILIAGIILTWTSGILDSQEGDISIDIAYYSFELGESPLDSDPCLSICNDPGEFAVSCDGGADRCYCLLIQNNENFDVNYLVKTIGVAGTSVCNPQDILLGPFESNVFGIYYSKSIVGNDPEEGVLTSNVDAVTANT